MGTKCFSQEVKDILEYTEGEIKITVIDELLDRYGNAYPVYEESKMYRICAKIINKNRDILEKIKYYKEHYIAFLNPQSFKKVSDYESSNVNLSEGSGSTSGNSSHASVSNSSTSSSDSAINRALSMEPSEIRPNLDYTDDSGKLNTISLTSEVYKFKNDEINNLEVVGQAIAKPVKDAVPAASEDQADGYHNLQFNKSISHGVALSGTSSHDKAMSKTVSENKGANCNLNAHKNVDYVMGEAIEKAYFLEIPNLREAFWSRFWVLFTDNRAYSEYFNCKQWKQFM